MRSCDVCRLALNDDGYPYIVPLNFGLEVIDGQINLYFHSALVGYKLDLIKKDNRASFEMDCKHKLKYIEESCSSTMEYESVIGRGQIRILDEEEKTDALKKIVEQYNKDKEVHFDPAVISKTLVYVLTVDNVYEKLILSSIKSKDSFA